MRARLLLVSLVAFTAAHAAGAEVPGSDPAYAASSAAGAVAPLALTPPLAGPLLAGAEGAEGGGSSILYGALYGGLAGVLVGLGVGLIESGNYGRDIALGAGVGILIGAALGATHVFDDRRSLAATDGLGSPDRDPVLSGPRYVGVALGF